MQTNTSLICPNCGKIDRVADDYMSEPKRPNCEEGYMDVVTITDREVEKKRERSKRSKLIAKYREEKLCIS